MMPSFMYDALSDIEYHFRGKPPQTAMINWAFPVTTRATCNGTPHCCMSYCVKRDPTSIVSGSKDGDTGSIDRTGDMRWASIVADKEVQFADECCQSTERCLTDQIDWLRFHLIDHSLYSHLFKRTACQEDLCIKVVDKFISNGSEVFSRPATCGWTRSGMDANPGTVWALQHA